MWFTQTGCGLLKSTVVPSLYITCQAQSIMFIHPLPHVYDHSPSLNQSGCFLISHPKAASAAYVHTLLYGEAVASPATPLQSYALVLNALMWQTYCYSCAYAYCLGSSMHIGAAQLYRLIPAMVSACDKFGCSICDTANRF